MSVPRVFFMMMLMTALSAAPAAAQSQAAADPFVRAVTTVKPAVVAVGTYRFADNPSIRYFGTGFVVDDGRTVVTNNHVLDAIKKQDRMGDLRVFLPDKLTPRGRLGFVLARDPLHDVALIRFEGPPLPALTLDAEAPLQGQSVGVMGYPIGLQLGLVPAAHRGVVAAVVPAVLPLPKGAKLNPETTQALRDPYDLYQLDLTVFPGNSGSPLFEIQDGKVIGIINKTLAAKTREHLLDQPSGIAYAVPARWINELLKRARLEAPANKK